MTQYNWERMALGASCFGVRVLWIDVRYQFAHYCYIPTIGLDGLD